MRALAVSRTLLGGALARPVIARRSPLHRRTIFGFGRNKELDPTKTSDGYYRDVLKSSKNVAVNQAPSRGGLSDQSIFDEPDRPKQPVVRGMHRELVLNPKPDARRRWMRKMTIRAIQKRGKLSKAQLIKQMERESQSQSRFFKTSVKKLAPLARQIAGKPVDEALVQMQFSKKKAAKEIHKFLQMARDEAVFRRGMGLANADPELVSVKNKSKIIRDPTKIYVSQAWVGRGKFTKEAECRARGRTNILYRPTTQISVLLKEEYTRIREMREKQARMDRKRVWTQLPDRPITTQRQYYTW